MLITIIAVRMDRRRLALLCLDPRDLDLLVFDLRLQILLNILVHACGIIILLP